MIFSRQSSIFEATLLKFSFKLHRIFDFRMHACTHSGFHHPPGLPLPPKPDWHTPYPPPGLVPPPHPPQSTLSQFFAASPVKTGTHSKIPKFSLPCALVGARAKKKVGLKLLSVGFIEKCIPLSTKGWSITISPSNFTLCMFFH